MVNPTARTVASVEEAIKELERRPDPTHLTIVEERCKSPWGRFREDPRILHPIVADLVEDAFDEGGFVAGGCARWLRAQPAVTALRRGAYVKLRGDIDLFFRNEVGWRRFSKRLLEDPRFNATLSKGSMALDVSVRRTAGDGWHGYNKAPTVQAIRCSVGSPEAILKGFDLANSMAAFDRRDAWVVDAWGELQAANALGVVWWGGKALPHRVQKYVGKYGYSALRDASGGRMVEQLSGVAATRWSPGMWEAITKHLGLGIDLGTRLTIMACVSSKGLEAKEIFANASVVKRSRTSAYQSAVADVSNREGWSLSKGAFDPEQYCWATGDPT